jgi:two-component sensor histidine kinase
LSTRKEEGADSGAELRHRVVNLIQLLSTATRMRVQRAQDEETRRQLSWMLDTIGAVGVLQQRLLGKNGDDFAGFLEDMLPHWRRRCTGRPITLELNAEPVRVREQNLSALALVAHELVSNALSHAFPDGREGLVRVGLRRVDAANATFSIVDNGCGFDRTAVGDKTTLGLWLMKGLTAQIRGRLTTAEVGGVSVELEFPAPPL